MSKISNFLWRPLTDSLATCWSLFKRKVVKSPICSICGEQLETTEHCLLLCNWTSAVWFGSSLNYALDRGRIRTLDNWLMEVHQNKNSLLLGDNDMFSYVCLHLWEIWKHRCEVVMKGGEPNPAMVIDKVNRSYAHWMEAKSIEENDENGLSNQARCDLWCPPLPSEVKINIDGAWKSSNLTSGIGIIVRNYRRSSIAGASLHGSHNSAMEVEADAALRALQLAAHLRLQNIVIESDCQDIIKALNSYPLTTSWKISPIISKIMHLKPMFKGLRWNWIPRKANRVADAAAKLAKLRL